MILYRKVLFILDKKEEELLFGIPENEDELNSMFNFRFEQYTKKDYIDASRFPDKFEIDEYDREKKCVYFIVKWRDKIIGSIRMIKDDILPTEKDFKFKKPKELESIPRKKLGEFGRFIIIPLDRDRQKFLPRGFVMLITFDVLLEYCIQNNIMGGFSFIKQKLHNKMNKINAPINIIKPHKKRYPKSGILYKYFNQKDDPVIPIYFITEDFKNYLNRIISNKHLFEREKNTIKLKNSILLKAYRLFGII